MRVFLSHISEEAREAKALKRCLEGALPGARIFASSVDIHPGSAWLKHINSALADAKAVLTLCSPNSIRRPWVNFESGGGWSRGLPVIPICHKGLGKDDLPDPLHIFQAVELNSAEACRQFVVRLGLTLEITPAGEFDPNVMLVELKITAPERSRRVGIVLCHRQDEWEEGERSVFRLGDRLPTSLKGNWEIAELRKEQEFLSPDLHQWAGLVLANPWRARMKPETILAIAEWVRSGGRLLLLGFELGDRHHDGNLSELSHHFGIDPAADIVGPKASGNEKPYGDEVTFKTADADPHPFTTDLTAVQFVNVQTVRVDPGGHEWLRVGDKNKVYRPASGSVQYRDGTLTSPRRSTWEVNEQASWLPVAVEAPNGLCGAGQVHMIGTWDVLGRDTQGGRDNLVLLTRILDWLSGEVQPERDS